MSVHLIVFSKDRPLQLHGYLTSLFQQWHGGVKVDVLVKDNPPYGTAYYDLQREFEGRVRFGFETTFATNVLALLEDDAPLTCFGCDDAVFVAPVVGDALVDAFAARDDLLGVSLRLGANVRRGMWGQEQPHPEFLPDPHGAPWDDERRAAALLWDAAHPLSVGDWAYPWEVVGTVYRTDFVRRMVSSIVFSNPSTLEHEGSLLWPAHAQGRTLLRCWYRSRLVLPTVNVVQETFPNGVVGGADMDPGFLLECWNRGLRLDPEGYARAPADSWRTGDLFLRRVPG